MYIAGVVGRCLWTVVLQLTHNLHVYPNPACCQGSMDAGQRGGHQLTKLSLCVNRTILFQGSQHQEQIQTQYEVGVEANAFGKCNNFVFVRSEIINYEYLVNLMDWTLN